MKFLTKAFKDEVINLDSNEYVNCIFENCEMIYSGSGDITMNGCQFNGVKWGFSGNAANTLNFMQAIYHGGDIGGRQLIEDTFESIRKGSLSRR